ncbi:hypothetical protein AN189_00570 [Loktanella sp. 3ANDIMAR09]|uniref:hypothetical protein n=1 Tax=Loktanella sp. 3ANDIMAR09 TaxID=1225657 RepID=UPI0006F7C9B7|nr:hypothetical protein [Loktanella sp. 3ANDIMAR09]KQI69943.1 hypothetical protein AN189_00570 [Loktanella sp. 3ANDIMAR09]
MKKLIIPFAMVIIGAGAGAGAAFFTRPPLPEAGADLAETDPCGPAQTTVAENADPQPIETGQDSEFAVLGKQFIVPVIEGEALTAMMLVSISIEVPTGQTNDIYDREPRLRDSMLQDLFAHANIGGFSGNYTENSKMQILRTDLLRSARDIVGETALDVLVLDIIKQDV